MFEDEKKKCTGAGARLESTVNSLEKFVIPSAVVIAAVGAIACLLTKNLAGILGCLVNAFIYAVALYVAVLILRFLADMAINSEVSARVTASEHDAKVTALTSYNTKKDIDEEDDVPSNNPFAAKKPASKAAPANNAFAPVKEEKPAPKVEKKIEEKVEEPAKPEVKEEPKASAPVKAAAAVAAKETKPALKAEKKEEPKTTRPSRPSADKSSSKKEEPSLLKSSLSSGGGEKLPGSGSDKDRVPTTINKTFKPIGGPAPAAVSDPAPSPFKPLSPAPTTKSVAPVKEESSAPSPFKPLSGANAAKEEAPKTSAFKPIEKEVSKPEPKAKVETKSEEKGDSEPSTFSKTFTPSPFAPSPAANNLEPAPSPFKPLTPAAKAAVAEKESAADAAMAKLNKLHKCPSCEVMINTNPCPRCGHEILLEDLLNDTKAPVSAPASSDSKSSINKLHKCSNCGRIAKQSPCEHCGT